MTTTLNKQGQINSENAMHFLKLETKTNESSEWMNVCVANICSLSAVPLLHFISNLQIQSIVEGVILKLRNTQWC